MSGLEGGSGWQANCARADSWGPLQDEAEQVRNFAREWCFAPVKPWAKWAADCASRWMVQNKRSSVQVRIAPVCFESWYFDSFSATSHSFLFFRFFFFLWKCFFVFRSLSWGGVSLFLFLQYGFSFLSSMKIIRHRSVGRSAGGCRQGVAGRQRI